MRIALIAAPFIAVPPADYGGTELFVAHLAEGLQKIGVEVVVYANADSSVNVERRWMYEHSEWPLRSELRAFIRELNHNSWAIDDARESCEIIHVQSAQALALSRFLGTAFVLTLHGPHEPALSEYYASYPSIHYVAISEFQAKQESIPRLCTIHHGIDLNQYPLITQKQTYLSFIGRIAPVKGTHIAIDVAQRTGIPLKIAGEVQPAHREYFERKIRPRVDGKLVEYVGPADLKSKTDLLGNSMAMLFPIQWNEPFGLVMVEAMACGTPVLAMPGGSVPEIVREEVSGYICRSVPVMAKRLRDLKLDPTAIRHYVEEHFSTEKMVGEYLNLYQRILA